MDFATFARDYGAMTATLIVGIVGFAGVITAQFVNANLARRQRCDAIEHDRRTLRTALIAELKTVRDQYTRRTTDTSLATGHAISTHTASDIHRQVLDKLGLLTVDHVQKVIVAYQVVQALPENVRIKKRQADISLEGDTEDSILIPPSIAAEMPALYKEHGKYFDDAITALGG